MTRQRAPARTWPFLLLLLLLFVGSLHAPRGWERIARPHSWRTMLDVLGRSARPAVTARSVPEREATTGPTSLDPKSLSPQSTAPTSAQTTSAKPSALAPVVADVSQQVPPPSQLTFQPALIESPIQPRIAGRGEAPTASVWSLPPAAPLPMSFDSVAHVRPEATSPRHHASAPIAELASMPARPQPSYELNLRATTPVAPAAREPAVRATDGAPVCWWPEPVELLEKLDRCSHHDACRSWAKAVRERVAELQHSTGPRDPHAVNLLNDLTDLYDEQTVILATLTDPVAASDFRRAGIALVRRLDVWNQLPELVESEPAELATSGEPQRLEQCLVDLQTGLTLKTGPDELEPRWHRYLLIDALRDLAGRGHEIEPRDRQRIAARVLSRLERIVHQPAASPNIPRQSLAALHTELRRWAQRPVETRNLVLHLEQFERTALPSYARVVAEQQHRLAWAAGGPEQQLAQTITSHYRNANLRLNISNELFNRVLKAQPPRDTYLNDMMFGHETRGWATTWTDVKIRLLPDPHRARLLVEANGTTMADTVTLASIVRLRSNSVSTFNASKEIELGLAGLKALPSRTAANIHPRLTGVESNLDFVPVLGLLVQSVAESQFEENVPLARQEARRKIARQVNREMDQELAKRIEEVNKRLTERFLSPLDQLELAPELIDAQTTDQRMTMRLRFAADDQLAGHGARPRAPSDSLASVQIHQSLFNNVFQQLHLDGRTMSLGELRTEVSQHLGPSVVFASADHDDLQLTFANENPLVIRCEEGRIEFNLALSALQLGRDVWRDFVVRVYYKPDPTSPVGQIDRDGPVQLIGDRLGPRAQIALRSIFSKAFAPSKSLRLLPAKWTEHPGLADLHFTQFDIHDGWIGMAIAGRESMAARAAAASKLR